MRLFGIIGYPLSHSFSPGYFTTKFEKEGIIDCRYDAFPLASLDFFTAFLEETDGLVGLNVTIPYKSLIIPHLHYLSEEARGIGAVNVVKIKNGILTGYNSDVFGFEKSLVRFLPPSILFGIKALVLGTGGAAKAVKFSLKKLGIPFLNVSRHNGPDTIVYEEITASIFAEHQLIINTTPLGMSPNLKTCPSIPYGLASPDHYFFDLVYNPEKTRFLALAEAAGANTQNGLSMLYLQAERAWEIWNSPDL
ncbi:MAG: shikimate dehydrogenase [Bacteroidetes bacterium]|nr:shikimate dehydrogenase [Bacteroidota bacterium]